MAIKPGNPDTARWPRSTTRVGYQSSHHDALNSTGLEVVRVLLEDDVKSLSPLYVSNV